MWWAGIETFFTQGNLPSSFTPCPGHCLVLRLAAWSLVACMSLYCAGGVLVNCWMEDFSSLRKVPSTVVPSFQTVPSADS